MDIWDWLAGLRRWWWMIIVFPIVAAIVTWLAVPDPQYESTLTMNIVFGRTDRVNSPLYIDGSLLDEMDRYLESNVVGDVLYTRLPAELQQELSRDEFGAMFSSTRTGHFVDLTVSGRDPDTVRQVVDTFERNITEVTNLYAVFPDYGPDAATITTLTEASEPTINTDPRSDTLVLVTALSALGAVAMTVVAEWMRLGRPMVTTQPIVE